MAPRGNCEYVERDIYSIIAWWKAGVPIDEMSEVYQTNHARLSEAIRQRVGEEEFARLRKQHRTEGNLRSGVRWKKGCTQTHMHKGMVSPRRAPIGAIRTFRVKARYSGGNPRRRRFIKTAHNEQTGKTTWTPLSQWRWEQAYGPIPKGHYVIFADGNSMRDELENLILTSFQESAPRAVRVCDQEKRRQKISRTTTKSKRAAALLCRVKQEVGRLIHECADCGANIEAHTQQCPKCGSRAIVEQHTLVVPEYVEEDPLVTELVSGWETA